MSCVRLVRRRFDDNVVGLVRLHYRMLDYAQRVIALLCSAGQVCHHLSQSVQQVSQPEKTSTSQPAVCSQHSVRGLRHNVANHDRWTPAGSLHHRLVVLLHYTHTYIYMNTCTGTKEHIGGNAYYPCELQNCSPVLLLTACTNGYGNVVHIVYYYGGP